MKCQTSAIILNRTEGYENLEDRAVTVKIAVCCHLTPRGFLHTYRCTGTPAASIVIYAEEKVPDCSETLIYIYKTKRRHIPGYGAESLKVLNFNPVRVEIFCLSFRPPMLVVREIRVQISALTPAITRLFLVFCISTT
jgi:hypothetical protein